MLVPSISEGVPAASIFPAKYPDIRRSDFPTDFKFGASTSALQTEGPPDIGGRGSSTWDSMIGTGSESSPGNLGDATLSYIYYKEDVQLLKNMGVDVYRFSISWSRILPNGKGEINQKGIDFYHNLIDELVKNGIEPFVTLFHFDLPDALQKEYNGFLDSKIVYDTCSANPGNITDGKGEINQKGIDFYHNLIDELVKNGIEPFVTLFHFDLPDALQKEYNGFLDSKIVYDTCSANPGNITDGKGEINQKGIDFYHNLIDELVKNGIEPFVTLFHFDLPDALQKEYNGFLDSKIVEDFKNYCDICFKNFGAKVKRWTTINEPSVFAQYGYKLGLPIPDDPTKNPYIAAHNIILAHSAAARLYRENYKGYQGGEIGISVSIEWFEPYSASIADKEATTRAFSFLVGWFLEPLVYGDYPFMMKALVRDRLPTFKDEEKEVVKGGIDFIGINYYTSRYARSLPLNTNVSPVGGYIEDQYVKQEVDTDGRPIGDPVNGNPNIYSVPDGLRDALIYMKNHYNNPTFYITENGISEPRDDTIPLEQALVDYHRIMFILRHLNAVKEAIREGVNVKSHFVWALIDCMEVGSGYSARFGLNYTDYSDNKLRRYPKRSAQGLSQFLKD